jgi:hypothetical protein
MSVHRHQVRRIQEKEKMFEHPAKCTKAVVIINENHSLLPQQVQLLREEFKSYEEFKVPATGWTKEQIFKEYKSLGEFETQAVVMLSPIPLLLGLLASRRKNQAGFTFVFHNDKREKKELPNGKVVYTVAQEGWQLMDVNFLSIQNPNNL